MRYAVGAMPKHGDEGLDLPDAAFAPPPEEDRPLELDPEWLAERAAKQAAANQPPPNPRRQIAGVIVAILLIAIVAGAVVWLVTR